MLKRLHTLAPHFLTPSSKAPALLAVVAIFLASWPAAAQITAESQGGLLTLWTPVGFGKELGESKWTSVTDIKRQPLTAAQFESIRRSDICNIVDAIEQFGVRLRNEGLAHPGLPCYTQKEPRLLGYAAALRVRSSDPPATGGTFLGVSQANTRVMEFARPAEILGLKIHEGDLLYADCHGVAPIPEEVSDRVPTVAAEIRSAEARMVPACLSPHLTREPFCK